MVASRSSVAAASARCETDCIIIIVVVVPVVGAIAWLMRPVCVQLTAEQLREFNVPIEQRTDRDFYLNVFQRRNGEWHQCKTALFARSLLLERYPSSAAQRLGKEWSLHGREVRFQVLAPLALVVSREASPRTHRR